MELRTFILVWSQTHPHECTRIRNMVGPKPIDDGNGKEIATQIKTTIGNNKTFYTDSNGRDFVERILDYRADWDLQVNQPIARNYYPVCLINRVFNLPSFNVVHLMYCNSIAELYRVQGDRRRNCVGIGSGEVFRR